MEIYNVDFDSKKINVAKFDESDEAEILDSLWVWKISSMLKKQIGGDLPGLPAHFSERFVCYLCGLHHKKGRGPDAFLLDKKNKIIKRIEIKATTTPTGYQEIKSENYDELYWFRFHEHAELKFEIYKFSKERIEKYFRNKSNPKSKQLNLIKILDQHERPIISGRIGVKLDQS